MERPVPPAPFPFPGCTLTRDGVPTAAFGKVFSNSDARGERPISSSIVHAYAGQRSMLRTGGSVSFGSTTPRPTSAPAISSTGLMSATLTRLDQAHDLTPSSSRKPPIPRLDLMATKNMDSTLLSTSPCAIDDVLTDTVPTKEAEESPEVTFNQLRHLLDPARLAAIRSPPSALRLAAICSPTRRAVIDAETASDSQPEAGSERSTVPRRCSAKPAITPRTECTPRRRRPREEVGLMGGLDWMTLPIRPAGVGLAGQA